MIPYSANFSLTGTMLDINESFSKLRIFHDKPKFINDYFICDDADNVIITCIKGMIVLVTCNLACNLAPYNVNEYFIGESNRYLMKIEKNTAFAWMNISDDISTIITNIDHITCQFDPQNEDQQESVIGFAIPYKFY